ncbi:G1/S-specific cyclin-D2-like [Erpetoichthys calabaricus]|uniref:G1/S-specific cyclin-D2-like n=1 Tax=Erpetoichthys calabaricus TaxID=27687 RepID=UPI00109F8DF8|nr:G1/S-specific cyclin-D2-like [Erpetoichthys calabaricus]XP_051789564.1 G1/S-specific cyclin-D2-like [Erpetoichthys calabaricus]
MDEQLLCMENQSLSDKSCSEEPRQVLRAPWDSTQLYNERVLLNLLALEQKRQPRFNYFGTVQFDLLPFMRQVLARWMLEVCEEANCESNVFPLAMDYLDRYLSSVGVKKSDLQVLGCACIFIASKMLDALPLTSTKICIFTLNSVTRKKLLDWEVYVVEKLKWDLLPVLPNDYLEHILLRLPNFLDDELKLIRKHACTFTDVCTTELQFIMWPPSLIMCASIGVAVRFLDISKPEVDNNALVELLSNIISTDLESLRSCQEQLECLLQKHLPKKTC